VASRHLCLAPQSEDKEGKLELGTGSGLVFTGKGHELYPPTLALEVIEDQLLAGPPL
jgi:hypothetical protein